MPVGDITVGSLGDSLDVIIDAARTTFESPFIMPTKVRRVVLPENTGTGWDEIRLDQISAQLVTETTVLDNPQQVVDTLTSFVPVISGITMAITDRVARRINKLVLGKLGMLAGDAIERKRDEDGLALFAGATTTLAGAGTTLVQGNISAGARQITSNTTERPPDGPIHAVLHGFQIHDLHTQLTAPVGTYPIPAGLSEEVYKKGFRGIAISGVGVWEDGNIALTGTDARGGLFHRDGLIYVEGMKLKRFDKERPELGGGAHQMWIYTEYIYGEIRSVWHFGVLSDATAPTS